MDVVQYTIVWLVSKPECVALLTMIFVHFFAQVAAAGWIELNWMLNECCMNAGRWMMVE